MNPATRMMVQKLNALAEQGMGYQQAADELGVTYFYVASYAKRFGIPLMQLRRGRKLGAPDARSEEMRLLYIAGQTLQVIGDKFGITRERVRQILTKHYGIRSKDGGQSAIARKARAAFAKKRDARLIRRFGCDYKQYRALLKRPDKPTYAFTAQCRNARSRDIGWELSLWQWWKIWEQSGHWPDRGVGHGYCMCRMNDTGPYAADNVYIGTNIENIQDYWINKRASETLEAAQ